MKKKLLKTMTLLLVVLLLSTCNENVESDVPVSESKQSASVTMNNLPSTDLKDELSNLWSRIDGSTATIPLTAALYDCFGVDENAPVHNTTPYAYENLISRRSDLIFVTYPSENELNMAQQYGVELEIIPIVKDALVFLVNIENPVDNLTKGQISDIYTGSITNWISVGGFDAAILPYQRTADSGSQTLLLKLVMAGKAPMSPPDIWVADSMGDLVESIASYDNSKEAVGYSMFYYVNNMYGNSRFKLLSIDGVKPSRDTIMNGEYIFEDFYYAIIRKDTPDDSSVRALIDWMQTLEGQTLAARAGYIPLLNLEGIFDSELDPVYVGDIDNSSGTGGTTLKSIEDIGVLVSNGVRKPLSDVFYNGFNYIEYINGEIINQLQTAFDEEHLMPVLVEDRDSKRSFHGIPNDYPHYELSSYGGSSVLIIQFSADNPFFTGEKNVHIPLFSDISPYGVRPSSIAVTYHYNKRMLPNVDIFTPRVKLSDAPDIAFSINKQLKAWVDGFFEDGEKNTLLEDFAKWYGYSAERPYRFQPQYGRWQNYLSVSYRLETFDGTGGTMPMLHTICFDIMTGSIVNLADILPSDLLVKEMWAFTPINSFKGKEENKVLSSQESIDNYIPPAGTIIDAAWLQGDMLGLRLTEPNGRKLQALLRNGWN